MLGLKDFRFKIGQKYRFGLKDLYWEIRYAFQRAWRGYDSAYCFDLDYKLSELIPTVLKRYRYDRHGSSFIEGSTEENCHENYNKMLDQMLYYFKESNEEESSQQNEFEHLVTFEPNSTNINCSKEIWENYCKRSEDLGEYQSKNKKLAYEMLSKYIETMCD